MLTFAAYGEIDALVNNAGIFETSAYGLCEQRSC